MGICEQNVACHPYNRSVRSSLENEACLSRMRYYCQNIPCPDRMPLKKRKKDIGPGRDCRKKALLFNQLPLVLYVNTSSTDLRPRCLFHSEDILSKSNGTAVVNRHLCAYKTAYCLFSSPLWQLDKLQTPRELEIYGQDITKVFFIIT